MSGRGHRPFAGRCSISEPSSIQASKPPSFPALEPLPGGAEYFRADLADGLVDDNFGNHFKAEHHAGLAHRGNLFSRAVICGIHDIQYFQGDFLIGFDDVGKLFKSGLNQDFISLFLKMPVESKYVLYFVMSHACKTDAINVIPL